MPITKTDDIYTKLSEKYSLHRNIIIQICNHPFIFTSRRISDPDDEKTFMYPNFGKVRLKRRYVGKKRIKHDQAENKKMFGEHGDKGV